MTSKEATDIIPWVAVIVSIATAAFTAYQQYFRGPRLSLLLPSRADLGYSPGYRPVLVVDIVFVNDGARYAPVISMSAQISFADQGWSRSLYWRTFVESEQVGSEERFQPWWMFKGWATAIVVPGRQAIRKGISFDVSGVQPGFSPLEPGEYVITVDAVVGPRHRTVRSQSCSFKLSDAASQFMVEKCVADPDTRVRKHSLTVRLSSVSRRGERLSTR